MNAIDDSQTYESVSDEQSPSLLVIILDTNPIAWSLLSSQLTLSAAVSALLTFINAHLACAYTNKVAVIASHCSTAKYLYPSNTEQHAPQPYDKSRKRAAEDEHQDDENGLAGPAAKLNINGSASTTPKKLKLNMRQPQANGQSPNNPSSAKYRAFRLIEEELLANLTTLLNSTQPSDISTSTTSTLTAGALTLALSYINAQKTTYTESTGRSTTTDLSTTTSTTSSRHSNTGLQSRILLLSTSPSTDLAHQYIPIMNAIFACQRLSIPIDILSIPLPSQPATSTVFLQQAADATTGIYIPVRLSSTSTTPATTTTPTTIKDNTLTLLQYLLQSFLPSPSSRTHLVAPTRIDVDFRAACFCHRTVIDTGFVCSVCLSIFCEAPADGVCLTCGTELVVGEFGARPVVVGRKKKRRKGGEGVARGSASASASGVGTPVPG